MNQIRDSYDAAAKAYAAALSSELDAKPLDRHLLERFAESVRGRGVTIDLGCGPGHVGRFLHDRGVEVLGIDLSAGMIAVAAERNPKMKFKIGDMRSLDVDDGSVAGIAAFYSIVHFEQNELEEVFREMRRVIRPGGLVFVAFHAGDDVIHRDELFGAAVSLDFRFHQPLEVCRQLRDAGLRVIEHIEREPYEGVEHPSRRAYLFATT